MPIVIAPTNNRTRRCYRPLFRLDASNPSQNAPHETTNQQQYHVLLVDDEPAILDAVSQLLLDTGKYQVTTCQDGATALQWALTEPRPQLIVSDIRMPDMDGLDLLRAIRSSSSPTIQCLPVVLLTAKSSPHDRVAGYNAGADAYLPKPFDPAELLAIVENVLQRNPPEDSVATIQDLQRDLDEIKSRLLVTSGKAEKPVFLAPDERSILELVCEGLTNKEIAKRTYKTSRRVEQVLTILFRKAGVKNRTELVRWAVANRQVKL